MGMTNDNSAPPPIMNFFFLLSTYLSFALAQTVYWSLEIQNGIKMHAVDKLTTGFFKNSMLPKYKIHQVRCSFYGIPFNVGASRSDPPIPLTFGFFYRTCRGNLRCMVSTMIILNHLYDLP